ncbi:hypothetical protein IJ732_05290 [bacterium]|nr:hypothetical protein [bacterium]
MQVNAIRNLYSTQKINTTAERIKSKVVSSPKIQAGLISSAAASAVIAASLVKPQGVSVADIENKLIKKGYQKNDDECLEIALNDAQKERIEKKYGDSYASFVIWNQNATEFSKKDIEDFSEFINIDKKLGSEMFNKHFDDLVDTYIILKCQNRFVNLNDKIKKNPDMFKLIYNVVTTDLNKDYANAVCNWKGKSNVGVAGTAQNFLRENANKYGVHMPESSQNFVENLSKLIDEKSLPESIKLYRREGMEVLSDVKLQDGKHVNFAQMMKDVANSDNKDEKLQELKEFILDNEIVATQPAYMATSIDKDVVKSFKGPQGTNGNSNVVWNFSVKPNTKGFYIEGVNANSVASKEQEVLLQKGSKIKIEDINYNKYHDEWQIDATVSN